MSGLITVGWQEKLSLPELGIKEIRAKVDTGAKTSCLHAFEVDEYQDSGIEMVRFMMHPLHKNNEKVLECRAPVVDMRNVTDSGGHTEQRYVIKTSMLLNKQSWAIELTLTNRDNMAFRMLLGRTAMKGRIQVNPGRSFLTANK